MSAFITLLHGIHIFQVRPYLSDSRGTPCPFHPTEFIGFTPRQALCGQDQLRRRFLEEDVRREEATERRAELRRDATVRRALELRELARLRRE